MTDARLIRRKRFRAAHSYRRSTWSDAKNQEVFGDQTESHVHEWTLELHVVGPIDPETGFVADLGLLDRALEQVTAGWDGGDLNDLIPDVASGVLMPTTEVLARWLFERIEPSISEPARLQRVVLSESQALGSSFPA